MSDIGANGDSVGEAGKGQHAFTFIAAPEDLAPYLNSLYIWRCGEGDLVDVLPAYSGQMTAFVEGVGRMKFDQGEVAETRDAFFLAPLCQARDFHIRGPATMFGVSLNFRGWAAMTGLAVNECHDSFLDADRVLDTDAAQQFEGLAQRWRDEELDDTSILDEMAAIVRHSIKELPEAHLQVIDRTLQWLSASFRPDLEELYDSLPYSKRQVQRLVSQFFGQSPVRLVRRYRAVRAATLLSLPELSDEVEADIREAFYDQAHLIKELRFFTGRTSKRLMPEGNSPVHDMLGPQGYGSVDLFGSGEARQLGKDPA